MSINGARNLGRHIRDVFTLADYRPLLTDPDPSPQQRAKIAESCRFNFTLWVAFAICAAANGVVELRRQGDDTILGYIGFATAVGMIFIARKYYVSMRIYSSL